MKQKIFSEEV